MWPCANYIVDAWGSNQAYWGHWLPLAPRTSRALGQSQEQTTLVVHQYTVVTYQGALTVHICTYI